MPPAPHRYVGPVAVRAFLVASTESRREELLRLTPTSANRQPAFPCHFDDPGGTDSQPAGLIVLAITPQGVAGITRFLVPGLLSRFSLADTSTPYDVISTSGLLDHEDPLREATDVPGARVAELHLDGVPTRLDDAAGPLE